MLSLRIFMQSCMNVFTEIVSSIIPPANQPEAAGRRPGGIYRKNRHGDFREIGGGLMPSFRMAYPRCKILNTLVKIKKTSIIHDYRHFSREKKR